MKLIKDILSSIGATILCILKGILLSPLNALMIVIASIFIVLEVLLKRFKKVKNDLKSFIPTNIHRFKMWKRYRKRK